MYLNYSLIDFDLFRPLLLLKFYFLIFRLFSNLYINFFLFKLNKLFIGINYSSFYFFLLILTNTVFFSRFSFLDLIVSDVPQRESGRFELVYVFWHNIYNVRIYIKFFAGLSVPVLSMNSFFSSSSWMEREAWDMFGVKFLLHNDLRRILTDYGFYGHPLRKDFPLLGFIELRFSDLLQSICSEPITSAQGMRVFAFRNPWIKSTITGIRDYV